MRLPSDVWVASVCRNGRHQAIRLPRDMELDGDPHFATCPSFDPDFPSDIDDLPAEEEVPVW